MKNRDLNRSRKKKIRLPELNILKARDSHTAFFLVGGMIMSR